jgi:putative FmdB family regulatory protein
VPLYEYQCDACGHRFEVIQKFSDPPVATCPKCGGTVHKMQSAPAFHLKGTGWYVTDYAKSGAGTTKEKETKESETTKDTKSTDATKGTKDAKGTDAAKDSTTTKDSGATTDSKGTKDSSPASPSKD